MKLIGLRLMIVKAYPLCLKKYKLPNLLTHLTLSTKIDINELLPSTITDLTLLNFTGKITTLPEKINYVRLDEFEFQGNKNEIMELILTNEKINKIKKNPHL